MFGSHSTSPARRRTMRSESRRRSSLQQIIQDVQEKLIIRPKRTPLCWKIAQRVYHKYGLKHIVLLLVLLLYGFFGALVFVLIEGPAEERLKSEWRARLDENRNLFVHDLMAELFNNSKYVVFLPSWKTRPITHHLSQRLDDFERQLGVTFDPQHKISWDYWNAVLFTGTICTTIGYGHIYPRTAAGRVLTCIYALFGIPLVLTVLNDLGKLLTVGLKFPWFQCKRAWRRLIRLCTKAPLEKILEIERRERDNLGIFDLPIPVAVGLIIGWIFLCSATFLMWESRWTYLEAFYFFFISLSTVGLGDIVPDQPKMLLMMFGYIIVGLSLVSMSVNLIQIKLEKTYQGGSSRYQRPTSINFHEEKPDPSARPISSPNFRATLGILQSNVTSAAGDYGATGETHTQTTSRSSQTVLSFPVTRQAIVTGEGNHPAVRLLKHKQRSLTNLLQPAREIQQQQDLIRNALGNVGDAATVIIFIGDRMTRMDPFGHSYFGSNNDVRGANAPLLARPYEYSNRNGMDGVVMEVDRNRNESISNVSDA